MEAAPRSFLLFFFWGGGGSGVCSLSLADMYVFLFVVPCVSSCVFFKFGWRVYLVVVVWHYHHFEAEVHVGPGGVWCGGRHHHRGDLLRGDLRAAAAEQALWALWAAWGCGRPKAEVLAGDSTSESGSA